MIDLPLDCRPSDHYRVLDCGHLLAYRLTSTGVVECMQCRPPSGTPEKVGLLAPDGSLTSAFEIMLTIRRRNREGRMRVARELLEDAGFDGSWELLNIPGHPDGWPKTHRPGRHGPAK